jgi:hypothetical protein
MIFALCANKVFLIKNLFAKATRLGGAFIQLNTDISGLHTLASERPSGRKQASALAAKRQPGRKQASALAAKRQYGRKQASTVDISTTINTSLKKSKRHPGS